MPHSCEINDRLDFEYFSARNQPIHGRFRSYRHALFVVALSSSQERHAVSHLTFSRDNAAPRTIQGLKAIKRLREKYVVARNATFCATTNIIINNEVVETCFKKIYVTYPLIQIDPLGGLVKHDFLRENSLYDSLKRRWLMASQSTLIRFISLVESPSERRRTLDNHGIYIYIYIFPHLRSNSSKE